MLQPMLLIMLGCFVARPVAVPVRRRHLRQPSRGRDAGLFMDRAKERWEVLENVADRGAGIGGCVRRRRRRAGVPDGDAGFEVADGGGVGAGEFVVGVVFEH